MSDHPHISDGKPQSLPGLRGPMNVEHCANCTAVRYVGDDGSATRWYWRHGFVAPEECPRTNVRESSKGVPMPNHPFAPNQLPPAFNESGRPINAERWCYDHTGGRAFCASLDALQEVFNRAYALEVELAELKALSGLPNGVRVTVEVPGADEPKSEAR